jgi:hypothetical protein
MEAVRMSGRRTDGRGGPDKTKHKAKGKGGRAKPPPLTGMEAWRAAQLARTADVEARLARRIDAWARTWAACPLNACRRAGACRREADCRAIDRTRPAGPFTAEERATIRAALDAERARRAARART